MPAFPPLRALVFDMDGTLYHNPKLIDQYDRAQYILLSRVHGWSQDEARVRFQAKYTELTRRLGHPPSHLFTLTQLGTSDAAWADYALRHIDLKEYLKRDPKLRRLLLVLRSQFRLAVVTNNHRGNTLATLAALGVEDLFDEIMTLSESRKFKPSADLYRQMAARLGVEPEECLSIGDRYHMDLEPAARARLHTLLVRNMQDVYPLASVLRPKLARRIKADAAGVRTAAKSLKAGRLVVLPTDTVYGLASLPDVAAVRWIYRAKGRPEQNPLVLLLSDPRSAGRFARLNTTSRALIAKHWPGPLTLVLPIKPGTPWGAVTHGGQTVALRVPDHELTQRVIQQSGGALATTSANLSGQPAAIKVAQIPKALLCFCDLVLDGGTCRNKVASTVAQVTGTQVKVLRQGSVVIGLKV